MIKIAQSKLDCTALVNKLQSYGPSRFARRRKLLLSPMARIVHRRTAYFIRTQNELNILYKSDLLNVDIFNDTVLKLDRPLVKFYNHNKI